MSAQADAPGGKQSRWMSLVEAIANVVVGYVIAVLTQILVFPIFGLQVSLSDNLMIGTAFTAASIARSYALRRLFEQFESRNREQHAEHFSNSSLQKRPTTP